MIPKTHLLKNYSSNRSPLVIFIRIFNSPPNGISILKKPSVNTFVFTVSFLDDSINFLFALVRHFNLFPRVLGEIIEKHSIRELHVSLTQSFWRTDKWGYPVRFAGPGAEISAAFQSKLKT